MPRLQGDDRCGTLFGATTAANAFRFIDAGEKAFVYPDSPHGTDFLAAAAGHAFFFLYCSMSFWHNETPQLYQKRPGNRSEKLIILYYAILCCNLQGSAGSNICPSFSFFEADMI